MVHQGRLLGGFLGRSPHGERGLKYNLVCGVLRQTLKSLSSRRAWIEIKKSKSILNTSKNVALLTESVDWNLYSTNAASELSPSLSSRRAWIEIQGISRLCVNTVSLSSRRAWIEIVDATSDVEIVESLSSRRAWIEIRIKKLNALKLNCRSPHGERGLKCQVASRAAQVVKVALLTESADWNKIIRSSITKRKLSLSSRRAWIEIR